MWSDCPNNKERYTSLCSNSVGFTAVLYYTWLSQEMSQVAYLLALQQPSCMPSSGRGIEPGLLLPKPDALLLHYPSTRYSIIVHSFYVSSNREYPGNCGGDNDGSVLYHIFNQRRDPVDLWDYADTAEGAGSCSGKLTGWPLPSCFTLYCIFSKKIQTTFFF
jgi:hypothetical protein